MTSALEIIEAIALSPELVNNPTDHVTRLQEAVGELRSTPASSEQVAALAIGLARSGRVLDWSAEPRVKNRLSVDLPSTGGTSNKTPIIAPLIALAAANDRIFIPKFSSRGRLAGTIDMLEVVGYQADVSPERYRDIVAATGISNVVQGPEFAPADGRLMRLRRKARAMDIPELVVSSILAKKVATGCRNVVVDLKAGQDSKFGDLDGVRAGAELFADVGAVLIDRGHLDGLWVCATNTYRPQGRAFGRLAALWEAARVLAGMERGFLADLSLDLAARMLVIAGAESNLEAARISCESVVGERVRSTARPWLASHGASTTFIDNPDILFRDAEPYAVAPSTAGVLLDVDVSAIEKLLLDDAIPAGAPLGLILTEDPAAGSLVGKQSAAMLLMKQGSEPSVAAKVRVAEAIHVYRGHAAVVERPAIIHEQAVWRGGRTSASCWTRDSRAAMGVIRRRAPAGTLVIFNRKWRSWNLPAGHFEPQLDLDLAATMAREISEELGPEAGASRPEFGRDFVFRSVARHRDVWKSGSTGEWTFYDFEIFLVTFTRPDDLERLVQHRPDLLGWATDNELMSGRLATGGSIAPFPVSSLLVGDRFKNLY